MVYNGTFYLYTGHDESVPPDNWYRMYEWLVFSSKDMKTWTEHPVPLKVSDFKWAKGDAWASQVIERNGKFYWYVVCSSCTPLMAKPLGLLYPTVRLARLKMPKDQHLITKRFNHQTNPNNLG